jgi:hypothetical protein
MSADALEYWMPAVAGIEECGYDAAVSSIHVRGSPDRQFRLGGGQLLVDSAGKSSLLRASQLR